MSLQPPAYTGSHAGARSRVRQKSCLPEPSEAIARRCLYQLLQPHKKGADDELRAGYSSTSHLLDACISRIGKLSSWQLALHRDLQVIALLIPSKPFVCVQRWPWQVYSL